jgi:ketosteroid isomerase-like protein
MNMRALSIMMVLPAAIAVAAPASARQSPVAVLDELLAAERSLSDAAARLTPAEGIASLIGEGGVLMTPKGPVRGPEAALTSLRANPANAGKSASWHAIRGGISADGQQGFTLGYLDIEGGEPARAHRRYLAYWVRGAAGWPVAALKQTLRADNETLLPIQQPALPARMVRLDPRRTPAHAQSLTAAEKAFSDRAQQVGNRQAFQEFGRPDAIHIFGPTGFRIGLQTIGAAPEGAASPPQVNWSANEVVVASSGDLGVSIGEIRQNKAGAGPAAPNPFFTIWRRDDGTKPWRYIAE